MLQPIVGVDQLPAGLRPGSCRQGIAQQLHDRVDEGLWIVGGHKHACTLVLYHLWDAPDGKMKRLFGLMRVAIMGHPYPPGDSVEMTVSKAHLNNGERRI